MRFQNTNFGVLLRARVLSTQLVALDEIVELTIEDPVIRVTLKECDLSRLSLKYTEPDLILSTSKVLGSLDNGRIHHLWSSLISSREHDRYYPTESLLATLQYVNSIFNATFV